MAVYAEKCTEICTGSCTGKKGVFFHVTNTRGSQSGEPVLLAFTRVASCSAFAFVGAVNSNGAKAARARWLWLGFFWSSHRASRPHQCSIHGIVVFLPCSFAIPASARDPCCTPLFFLSLILKKNTTMP